MKAGIDETGLGSLAGPLCVGVVAIERDIAGPLRDSKKLSPRLRRKCASLIGKHASFVHVAFRENAVIDELGILEAWRQAVEECFHKVGGALPGCPVYADWPPSWAIRLCGTESLSGITFVRMGDDTMYEIQAASIVAKVERDMRMRMLGRKHREYRWKENSGYGTAEHRSAIRKFGLTSFHRRTFCSGLMQ